MMTEEKTGVTNRWIVLHHFAWGPFASTQEAEAFAKKNWPGDEYDVQVLRDPADVQVVGAGS